MPCKDYDNNSRNYEEIQLGDDKLNTLTTFKYLGSIFNSTGGAERDINKRVKLLWMKWKQLTGVLFDKKVTIKLKDKVYKRREQITCCSRNEDATMDKGYDQKIPRQKPGRTRGCQMSTFLRQKRLFWYGHITRRRQPFKENDGYGCTEEEKKGAA